MKMTETNVWQSILQSVGEIGQLEITEELLELMREFDDQLDNILA